MENLAKIAIAIVMVIIGGLWKSFVLVKMWQWFVTAEFGIDAPSLAAAWGLSLMAALLTLHFLPDNNERFTETLGRSIALNFVFAVYLGVAYTLSFFV